MTSTHTDLASSDADDGAWQATGSVEHAYGLLEANPVVGVSVSRTRKAEGKWLDADGVDRLAAAMPSEPYAVWVLVTAYAVAAVGRAGGAAPPARRPRATPPRGPPDASEVSGRGLVFGDAKTQGPVDLPGWVVDRLAAHVDGMAPDDLVFTTSSGTPLRYRNFRRDVFDDAVRACGWTPRRDGGVTPHVLRHSAASILVAAGAHPQMVRVQMRHSSIQVTYDVYGHLFDGAVADVWERHAETRRGAGVVDLEERRRQAQE